MISAPFRLRRTSESIAIEGGDGRVVGYLYFTDDAARRNYMRRLTSDQATEAAKVMARALQEAFPEAGRCDSA